LPESPSRDTRALQLVNPLIQVLWVTRGYGATETVGAVRRARTLAEKSGDLVQLAVQLQGTWSATVTSGDLPAASALADQMLDLARREGSAANLGFAHAAQIVTRYFRGDLAGVEQHFEIGTPFFAEQSFRQIPGAGATAFGIASLNAWTIGKADTACSRIHRAVELARSNNSPYDLAFTQFIAGVVHFFVGEAQEAENLALRALALSDENSFPYYGALSRIVLGRARAELGHPGEGVTLMRQGVNSMVEIGARVGLPLYLTHLAQGQMLDGAVVDALVSIGDAMNLNPEELAYRPETFRVRGELRLKQEQEGPAELDFREAIALAQKIGAIALELTATTSLARLLRRRGAARDARDLLTPLYGSFDEGLATRDLRQARTLLAELVG
jgi:tetratricopeptide (TPR) repeat protein